MAISAQSDRLVLRRPEPRDGPAYLELLRASEDFHRPWFVAPPAGCAPFGRDVFRTYLAGDTGERCLRLLIFRRDSPGAEPRTLVGAINFNREALGLAVALGFRREGLALRHLKIAGEWQDHERWARLADEV